MRGSSLLVVTQSLRGLSVGHFRRASYAKSARSVSSSFICDSYFTCILPSHFSRGCTSYMAIVFLAYGASHIREVHPSGLGGFQGWRGGY